MDRFEATQMLAGVVTTLIYIPVWIDLKLQKQQQVQDMFLFIYIPVWIDLKLFLNKQSGFSNNIYIPVWIDLKLRQALPSN